MATAPSNDTAALPPAFLASATPPPGGAVVILVIGPDGRPVSASAYHDGAAPAARACAHRMLNEAERARATSQCWSDGKDAP